MNLVFTTNLNIPFLRFQTMNSFTSNNLSSKYQRFIPPGFKDKGV